MKRSIKPLAALLLLISAGCASQPLKIANPANRPYDVVGEGTGKATGLMVFGVIPVGQNQRFVKAYDIAVKSKGGDALIDPVISEKWFWGYVLDGYSTTITGTVIKYK